MVWFSRADARGCAGRRAPRQACRPRRDRRAQADDAHIPPFARWPYQLFSREAAVQIALREWRAFGSAVVYPEPGAADMTPSAPKGCGSGSANIGGSGLPMGAPEQGFTGMHDQNGAVFPGHRGRQLRLVGGVYRLRHADGRGGTPLPLFADPCRLHQRRQRARNGAAARSGDHRRAAGELRAAARRPDLHVARPPADPLRRSADRALSRALRHRRRHPSRARSTGSAAMSTTRSRCGISRSPRMAISLNPTAPSSTPIIRGSS